MNIYVGDWIFLSVIAIFVIAVGSLVWLLIHKSKNK